MSERTYTAAQIEAGFTKWRSAVQANRADFMPHGVSDHSWTRPKAASSTRQN